MKKHKKGKIIFIVLLCISIFFVGIILFKNRQSTIIAKTEIELYTPISDIYWNGSFEIISTDYNEALDIINNDTKVFENYLINNDINDFKFSNIEFDEIYEKEYDQNGIITKRIFFGYRLIQKVTVHSSEKDNIKKIKQISHELPELSSLISMRPHYSYTEWVP
jgi:hypothetical protein